MSTSLSGPLYLSFGKHMIEILKGEGVILSGFRRSTEDSLNVLPKAKILYCNFKDPLLYYTQHDLFKTLINIAVCSLRFVTFKESSTLSVF